MKYKLTATNLQFGIRKKNESIPKLLESGIILKQDDCNEDWFEIDEVKSFIEISTLADLQTFIKKFGRIVLDEDTIEIYWLGPLELSH